jgi:hypothetical protein
VHDQETFWAIDLEELYKHGRTASWLSSTNSLAAPQHITQNLS